MEIGGIDNQYLFDQAMMPGLATNKNPFASNGVSFEDRLKAVYGNTEKSANLQSPIPSPQSPVNDIDKNSKLFEMCMELETFLLKNLISSMRNTVQKTGLMDTGFAGKFYEDMLYDEYAKSFAKNAGFGFAEMAYRELSRSA